MTDYNNLANKYNNKNVQVFISTGVVSGTASSGSAPQMWHKPLGITMINIVCIGSGGAGGGGRTRASLAASNASGGGGGGSAGLSSLLIPADQVPGELFVYVARPSFGGGAGVAGDAGSSSYVYTQRQVSGSNSKSVLISANGGGGGGAGSTGTATGGTAGGITARTSCPAGSIGIFNFVAGQAGAAGNAGNGNPVANWLNNAVWGGGGGGGAGVVSGSNSGSTGGAVNVSWSYVPSTTSSIPLVLPSLLGGDGLLNGDGFDGYSFMQPFIASGGSGAGNRPASGTGGRGGNGGIGSGGGGGGQGVTGGSGGSGGPGLVIITCW